MTARAQAHTDQQPPASPARQPAAAPDHSTTKHVELAELGFTHPGLVSVARGE